MFKSIIATCELAERDWDSSPARHLLEMQTIWLKFLKERYTWKPSKEQLEALEHFVRSLGESGYASPYENNTKLLHSLLEQLKKLKG